MAIALSPIPAHVPIVEPDFSITEFFRLRWQELIDGAKLTPAVAAVPLNGQTAAIVTAAAYLPLKSGLYRVSYYMRKTIADGVSSSLTFTWGWTESGVALSESGAALALDTVLAEQSGSKLVRSDALANLTYAIAYASNTPAKMTYRLDVIVEQVG